MDLKNKVKYQYLLGKVSTFTLVEGMWKGEGINIY